MEIARREDAVVKQNTSERTSFTNETDFQSAVSFALTGHHDFHLNANLDPRVDFEGAAVSWQELCTRGRFGRVSPRKFHPAVSLYPPAVFHRSYGSVDGTW